MWLSYVTVIIFVAFMLPISINMISIIKLNYKKVYTLGEEELQKKIKKKKIKKVVLLFLLLIIGMFFAFCLNFLI